MSAESLGRDETYTYVIINNNNNNNNNNFISIAVYTKALYRFTI